MVLNVTGFFKAFGEVKKIGCFVPNCLQTRWDGLRRGWHYWGLISYFKKEEIDTALGQMGTEQSCFVGGKPLDGDLTTGIDQLVIDLNVRAIELGY